MEDGYGPVNNPVSVHRAQAEDAAALAQLAALCFSQTFAADNRPEDLRAHLARSYGESLQRREILDPDWITLLARRGPALMGFAQVGRTTPPPCVKVKAVELVRFYLEASAHGRGIAQQLMSEVFTAARTLGGLQLWLGVWERNARAIAFYRKCGFIDVGSKDFYVGPDRQTDRVMQATVPEG